MKSRTMAVFASLIAATLTASILCSGCTVPTQAQRQAVQIHQTSNEALAALKACEAEVRASPKAQPLLGHMPPAGQMPGIIQLMDNSRVTPEEAAAIMAVYPRDKECKDITLNELAAVAPAAAEVMSQVRDGGDEAKIELLRGNITWGEYWSKVKKNVDEGRQHLIQVDQDMKNNLEREHEAELARRQAASAALLQAGAAFANQAGPSALPPGAYQLQSSGTHCTYGGGYMNC